jgi:hypothetical protein
MTRLQAISALVALTGLAGSACEALIGGVDVTERPDEGMGALQTDPPPSPETSVAFPPLPSGSVPVEMPAPPRLEPPATADAGAVDPEPLDGGTAPPPPDAAPDLPPAPGPRPVVVDAPSQLDLVGVVGGGPRLGTCQGGVVVGVRATANPSTEQFGQRLVFIEPLCASARVTGDPTSPIIQLTRNEALVNWSTSDPFLGVPSTDVPDSRLVWVPQPPAFCPDTAPVLVGLSGQYDPVAPDDTASDALRSLVIECAPLTLAANGVDLAVAAAGHLLISQADNFSASGSDTYRSSCAEGNAVTQIQLHSGYWLDGFVLGCSALRAPRAVGEACAGGRDCESGVCGATGSCDGRAG